MATYVHKEGDEITERVQTVPASHNDKVLAAKAADNKSGWTREDEPAPDAPKVQTVDGAPVGESAPATTPGATAPGDGQDKTPAGGKGGTK